MNCRKCGNILNEGDTVCRICGEPVQAMNQPMNGGVPGGAMPTPQPTPVPTPGVAPQVQQPVMTPTPSQPVITPEMANSGIGMGQTIAPGQPQPMNMGQPMMQQPMVNGANMGAPKDNKSFKIIIGVLLLVIIALGGFVAVKFIGGDKEETKQTEEKKKEPTKTETPSKTEDDDDDDDDDDPVVSEGNYFEYAGYKFTIPNDVKYQKSAETLMISDGQTYQVAITVDKSITYDIVKSSPDEVADAIAAEGIETKGYEFKTYDGVEYYSLKIELDGQAGVLYYAKLDDYACVMGMIVLKDASVLDTAYKVSSKIIKTGTTTSSFAPSTAPTPNYKISEDMKSIFHKEIVDRPTGE